MAANYPGTDTAEALGTDRSHVGRVAKLALLSPRIVRAIVDCQEASGTALERLVETMPMAWEG